MNFNAVKAIYKFELARTWRTLIQSLATPVITTSLYFIVFGSAIGSRMQRSTASAMAPSSSPA
jgi:ABC-2 type transport system permease protein